MDGSTISFKNLIEGIVKTDIQPIIVYPTQQYGELITSFETMGIQCFTCPICRSKKSNNINSKNKISFIELIKQKIKSFIKLYKIVKETKPDIIHTNTGVVHEGFLVAKMCNIPHVWHIREYQTLDFNWSIWPNKQLFIKELAQSYTVFITKGLQKYFAHNDTLSTVIYDPIYDSEEIRSGSIEKQKYFLIANRISNEKGIEDIIAGFAHFSKYDNTYSLKIAGFGDEAYINEIKTLCYNLNLSNRIEFLGYVTDVQNLIRYAEVLFVGSHFEGFGRMTAEANMLGTFVIGRNTGGTKEIIELTHGGSLFDNINEIPLLLNNYINKKNDVKWKILNTAQQIALNLFSKTKHCEQIVDLYRDVVSLSKRGSL